MAARLSVGATGQTHDSEFTFFILLVDVGKLSFVPVYTGTEASTFNGECLTEIFFILWVIKHKDIDHEELSSYLIGDPSTVFSDLALS